MTAAAILLPVQIKTCSKCLGAIPLHCFSKKTASRDGHNSECKSCAKAYKAAYHVKNRENQLAKGAKFRTENAELMRQIRANYRANNQDAVQSYNASWRIKNSEYSKSYRADNALAERERVSRWALNNPDKDRAKGAMKRAQKFKATPPWSEKEKILAIYTECQRRSVITGVSFHVDHIVPLKSKLVCGLHVAANLQVLTAFENISKHNKVWPDMP